MGALRIRVLIVDDNEPFRQFLRLNLQNKVELQTMAEASDGAEAIELAQLLQPDLILLDIEMPRLNGIKAARRIRELAPGSKIIFLSQESSVDVVQAAFSAGGSGYVVKMDAGRELLTAVDVVLRGEQFVGSRFVGHDFTGASNARVSEGDPNFKNFASREQKTEIRCHEAGFYSNDQYLLDDLTQFVGAALRAGNAAIVVATEPHRETLLPSLKAYGVDIAAAIEQGRYLALGVADALPTFMLRDAPDPVQFLKVWGNLISTAASAVKGKQARVAILGEMSPLLWAQGNPEAAIQVEELGNLLARTYDIDILCGYSQSKVLGGLDSHIFQRIRAAHSAVHSQ